MQKLLKKIFLVDLLQGLWVTFRTQHPKNMVTEQYPQTRPAVAERFRGAPRLNKHPETGQTLCIACDLCHVACNDGVGLEAIDKILNIAAMEPGAADGGNDGENARPTYVVNSQKCDGCSLCLHVCPVKDCISLVESEVYRVPPMWRPEEERILA